MTRANTSPAAKRDILRRRLDFEFDAKAVPKDWYAGDLHLTLFWDGLSLLFPKGEQFFVNSVKHYSKPKRGESRIQDPELLEQIAGFIGQESMHGKEHRAFNEMLLEHGLDNAPQLEAEVAALLNRAQRKLPPVVQLAVTCALEHFTAILAEQLLETDRHRAAIHESVRDLWVWHALEESEHKSVAFDAFRVVGGTYPIRVGTMLVTSLIFVVVASEVHIRLSYRAGEVFKPRRWLSNLNFFWGKPGLFRKLLLPYLDYFRPGFHPSDRNTDRLLAEWDEKLFGEEGTLLGVLKGAYDASGQLVSTRAAT